MQMLGKTIKALSALLERARGLVLTIPEPRRRMISLFLSYGAAIWISIAFLGYGLSLKQYEKVRIQLTSGIVSGEIESRSGWGLGWFGDVCFTIKGNPHWFCVAQRAVSAGIGNLFWQLKPGLMVYVRSHRYRVYYLSTSRPIYGNSVLARDNDSLDSDVMKPTGAWFFIIFSLLPVPCVLVLRHLRRRRPIQTTRSR